MNNERLIAYVLIGIGALALLSNLGGDVGWLWVGLVAAVFLGAYLSQRNYGFLVVGSILAGVALGILLEGNWGWDGAFLISLGAGFFAIDRVEPRKNRWPLYAAGILVVIGLISGLSEAGMFSSIWFALLLIAVGVYLILQRGRRGSSQGWVEVETPPAPVKPVTTAEEQPQSQPVTELAPEPGPEFAQTETVAEVELTELELRRYNRLEAWRKETASTQGLRAYLVLNNSTLRELAKNNPQTVEELKNIKGIGPVKLERYGQAILELLAEDEI